MNTSVRTRILSVLALTATMAMAPLAVSAASPADQGGIHQQQKAGYAHKGPAERMGRFARALDLTQEQKDQIFKIRHEQKATEYEQKKAIRAAAQELRSQSRADNFDARKAQPAADALGKAQAQLALQRAETHARINAVLTPEQRQKMADARNTWKNSPHKQGKGRHHGRMGMQPDAMGKNLS
ncbi:Spy/CpxP family protein refolding chaperone [Castellaniella sp.]|uniref:Spy/CpxP family protein refolding chaperone n=1 Tax=Castellaniella sp. TaxID=1955812 RepID=UPI00355F0024